MKIAIILIQVLILNSCVSFHSVTIQPKENITFTTNSFHSSYSGHSWLQNLKNIASSPNWTIHKVGLL